MYMTDDLASDNWATFEAHFTISVTLPNDFIGNVDVTSRIVDASNTNVVLYTTSAVADQLPVVKPTGATATSSTLISFGVDPSDSAKQGLGAALYSNTFCTDRVEVLATEATTYNKVAGDVLSNNAINPFSAQVSNFAPMIMPGYGDLSAYPPSASNCPGNEYNELDVPNAVELVFKTPYAIPDDRTFAEVQCTTQ